MSVAPIIIGTNKLPNPPIIIGITIKKIIIKAWAVTTLLNISESIIKFPGWDNSIRINTLNLVPSIPAHIPKAK
jgi:hypothetical protein